MDFHKLKYYLHSSLILVASSDRNLLEAIASNLSSQKYNFITAISGDEAWNIILQKKPAIVIADWTIPDISGLALCHRIKASIEHPELMSIYFVIIVEASNPQQRQIGLDAGVDEFLSKPIDNSELNIRLRNGLRASALKQCLTWTNQRLLAQNDLLDALTLSDPLTKVLNEQAFADVIPKMMMQFQSGGSYKIFSFLSVLIVDVDFIQQIIQSYGVQIGDEAIKAIAGRLTHSCVANSLIYRHGLDEFVCVTPHTDAKSGQQLANELLSSIRSNPIAVSSGLLFPLTVSIGGAVRAIGDQDIIFAELVSLAERSLLQAQGSGGNRAYIEEINNL